jgi:RNA polymerase sigma-70 factor (ECF subfamily)
MQHGPVGERPSPEERGSLLSQARATDGQLVRQALEGNRDAFGELVSRYERIVAVLALQKVGNRADAEDVAQEAFLKAYAALGELRDVERFGSWLYGIAFRAALDQRRRRARRREPVAIDSIEALAGPEVECEAARREECERVLEALGELPDKYRLVLTLRYQAMMRYQEIADHLGEPAGTISNRIHRAANILRERLREPWQAEMTR